jgi:WD40 repeat protein
MTDKASTNTTNTTNTTPIKGETKHMITDVLTKIYRGDGFMTVVIYNNRGDLMYIGDKNSKTITMIDVKTNKILGIFYGHNGTIWHLAVTDDDKILISCGADMTLCFFNATNGELIYKINNTPGIPKQVSVMDNKVVVYYESLGKRFKSYIVVYDLATLVPNDIKLIKQIESDNSNKPSVLKWFDSEKIIIGYESGLITIKDLFDESVQDLVYNFHTGSIKSLVFNNAKNMILTGSVDSTAKLIKIEPNNLLEVVYTCQSTCPVNCAIFSYNEKKIILAGGADAINVAMSGKNDFTIKLFSIKEKKLITQMSSHFGPVRCLVRAPKSKNYVSAGQDGIVKIYQLDEQPVEFDNTLELKIEIEIETFGIKEINGTLNSRDLINETNKLDYVNVRSKKVESTDNYIPGINLPNKNEELFVPQNKYLDQVQECDIFENEVNKTTVKISHLPSDITPNELREIFEFCGSIQDNNNSVKVISRYENTFAFIKYEYEEGAQRAIDKYNGKPFMHRIIEVELAKSR